MPDTTQRAAKDVVASLAAWSDHSTQGLRRFRRNLQRTLRDRAPSATVAAARGLSSHGISGFFVGCELLNDARVRPGLSRAFIHALARRLDSWVTTDIYSLYVLGPCWRDGVVNDAEIRALTKSLNRWRRRSALVATVALNNKARGGSGDTLRTLDICKRLVNDRDDMVVKAMSWALRELGKRDPAAASRFLDSTGDRLAARVRREVTRKLTTGTKSGR